MSKKPSLASALQTASDKNSPPVSRPPASKRVDKAVSQITPPSRQGKKAITGFFDPAVSRQLKQIALDEDKTIQSLLTEALNDLFLKYKNKPIA